MSAVQANCPACGAEVLFKKGSSVVVVCAYCNSVVARTDRGLEDLGRVAEISDSGSPLEVGLRGVYRGTAYELTGRAQLGHAAGGNWDEWYAAFADGRWGWLAEAQGRFLMSFQAPPSVQVPPYEALTVGAPVAGIPVAVPLVVAERGEARMLAAEGEIPYRLTPGESYRYADLSGPGGVFATIDYGDARPLLFVGREINFEELGLPADARKREAEAREVSAAQLSCPNCGGPLELRAPDAAERVTCPNCGSLLDINQGRLRYLTTLKFVGFKFDIPLGAVAEFEGHKMTVIGQMTRSVEFEGTRYFWQEYLLYNPAAGFRWLVQSDGHWSYVRPVPPGEVAESGDKYARYGGRRFKKFQDATARVEYVAGEFYWKVEAGETARAVDYVNAPGMLSKETSSFDGTKEVNWSHGTYMPVREVARKFGVELPKPTTPVAPNQPYPHKRVYRYWALLLGAALLAGLLTSLFDSNRKIFEQTFVMQPQPTPTPTPAPSAASPATAGRPRVIRLPDGRTVTIPPGGAPVISPSPGGAAPASGATPGEGTQVVFTDAFELRPRQNIRVTAESNANNSWMFVGGDLINEETGLVQQFDIPVGVYSGVEDGESWTEGSATQDVYISALPAGRYTMRLETQWEEWKGPGEPRVTVRVEQGVTRGLNFALALIVLSLIPVVVALRHLSFEQKRWADSAFNPYSNDE